MKILFLMIALIATLELPAFSNVLTIPASTSFINQSSTTDCITGMFESGAVLILDRGGPGTGSCTVNFNIPLPVGTLINSVTAYYVKPLATLPGLGLTLTLKRTNLLDPALLSQEIAMKQNDVISPDVQKVSLSLLAHTMANNYAYFVQAQLFRNAYLKGISIVYNVNDPILNLPGPLPVPNVAPK